MGKDAALPRAFTIVSLLSGPLMALGFDEQATDDARNRITAFFDSHLRPTAE
jgi:dienelactone hydrolase